MPFRTSASRLVLLLAGMADGAGKPLSSVPWLTEAERDLVVSVSTTRLTRYQKAVAQAFAMPKPSTPHAVALRSDEQTVTYAELQARARRWPASFTGLGVGPERLVTVLMDRSVDVVVAELAVLMAGGGYVPLGTRAHEPDAVGRRADLGRGAPRRSDVGAHRGRGFQRAGRGGRRRHRPRFRWCPSSPGQCRLRDVHSGSTGLPKGVVVRQRDIVEFAADRRFLSGGHRRVCPSPLASTPRPMRCGCRCSTATRWCWPRRATWTPPSSAHDHRARGTGIFLTIGLFRVIAQDAAASPAPTRYGPAATSSRPRRCAAWPPHARACKW